MSKGTTKKTLTQEQDDLLHELGNIITTQDGTEEIELTCIFRHKANSPDYEIIWHPADYLKAKIAEYQNRPAKRTKL